MTAVQVILPTLIGPANNAALVAPHATLTHPTIGTIVIPITDPAADYGDTAINWGQIERPRRDPLLLPQGNKLHVVTLKTTLIGADWTDDTPEAILNTLQAMSADTQPLIIHWGGTLESGSWQMTSCTAASVRRRSIDNHVTHATCTMEFTAATLIPPVPGQASPMPAAAQVNGSLTSATPPRRITVQAGQSMFQVSQQAYGSTLLWRTIAAANGLTDVTNLVPGTVLTIPNMATSS